MAAQKKKQETSKEIVVAVLAIFFISMVASYCLPIFFDYVKDITLQMFQTTATQTGSVLIGYYGKAGFENYDKNKKLLKFEKEKDEEAENAEPEGGNG